MVVKNDSNQSVVKREIEIDASPEEVWEAVTDPERWLGDEVDAPDGMEPGAEIVVRDGDGERRGRVESADPPGRLVWWWWREDEPATRVEVLVVAAPAATRVIVVESVPAIEWSARLQLLAGAARALVAA